MKRKFHTPGARTAKGPSSTVGFPLWVSEVRVGHGVDQPARRAFLPHSPDSAPGTGAAPLRVVSPLNGHPTARSSYTDPGFCISESSHLWSTQQDPLSPHHFLPQELEFSTLLNC